jgi:hypothetical protein
VSELRVVAERAMGAPAEVIYRCIADFDRHHPRSCRRRSRGSGWRRVVSVPVRCTASG